MKKRINLFSRKKRFDVFSAYATKIRTVSTIIGILLFLVFMFVIYNIYTVQKSVQELSQKKQLYLSVLLNEKDVEANIRYFKGKQTQLTKFEEDDAHFLPYYQVLNGVLTTSTESAILDLVEIDKNRSTTFTVKFGNYNDMIAFLKFVESPSFLENFDALSISSLSLSRQSPSTNGTTSINKSYQLQFKGKFKEINDKSG